MNIEDFDYKLPKELIAQTPLEKRDLARLMVVDRASGSIEHKLFRDMPGFLHASDVMVIKRHARQRGQFQLSKGHHWRENQRSADCKAVAYGVRGTGETAQAASPRGNVYGCF